MKGGGGLCSFSNQAMLFQKSNRLKSLDNICSTNGNLLQTFWLNLACYWQTKFVLSKSMAILGIFIDFWNITLRFLFLSFSKHFWSLVLYFHLVPWKMKFQKWKWKRTFLPTCNPHLSDPGETGSPVWGETWVLMIDNKYLLVCGPWPSHSSMKLALNLHCYPSITQVPVGHASTPPCLL